jgi:S-adenosylmethionine:tRNA ribosyltransferase-isomerase
MIAAAQPAQRSASAKLLTVDSSGRMIHRPRSAFVRSMSPGDLVVANDAATLPASLHGTHQATGASIEVRLAGRKSLAVDDVHRFSAIVFGAGDFHIRTEDRPAPPRLVPDDRLALGPLSAAVDQILGHPRLISLRFEGSAGDIWSGLSQHGRPIQYAHVPAQLSLWDVWTPIAGPPVAFEPPSAGFALDWKSLTALRDGGVSFASITHAAGISSTGDDELDRRLPFDEPYRIPESTARAIGQTRERGGRVVAVGTTVVRALEHAARRDGRVRPGEGLATQRIDATTQLLVVDAILTGVHEPITSHYQLLRAFTDDATLDRAAGEMAARSYRTHEFGDSVLIERRARNTASAQDFTTPLRLGRV